MHFTNEGHNAGKQLDKLQINVTDLRNKDWLPINCNE